jgi:hypothetical protein
MKFPPQAGEVEGQMTSRTIAYLERKLKEDNSMLIKRKLIEGMYVNVSQVLYAW